MSAQPASTQSTAPRGAPKFLSLSQEQIVSEFVETYGLDRKQISFDGNGIDPIFDFDALSILSLALSDIPTIRVTPGDFNNLAGLATADCFVQLRDERSRSVYGHALIGETLHDDKVVEDMSQALYLARGRALRAGLRAVGFDPVRAHQAAKLNQRTPTSFSDVRTRELAEAHILGEELCYILNEVNSSGAVTGKDKTAWVNLIGLYFPGMTSSGDLSDLQRSQFLQILRGIKRQRTAATEGKVDASSSAPVS